MENNFSKTEVVCTVTSADRKKIDSLKYHEALNPNSRAIMMNMV